VTDGTATGPLAQVRVLDLTGGAGRYAGKLLAEYGAEVVRVRPGERGPDLADPDGPGLLDWWHDAGCLLAPLDLDRAEDVACLRSLAAGADIVIDDLGPGPLADRGLAPGALAEGNPALVHVSLTPYGSGGPRAHWRSSDLVAQAHGGFLSITGDPDRPVALWGRQTATIGGSYAAIGALAGLRRARTTGRGAWVDLSLHQAVVSCTEHLLMYWWFPEEMAPFGAPLAGRQRSLHWVRAFEVVPCRRGACMVSPAAGGLYDLVAWLKERGRAADVEDRPDPTDPTLIPRMMAALKAVALESDATELFEAGQALHVPFGEAYAVEQVAACPQHVSRGFFRPVEGAPPEIRLPGPPARLLDTPAVPPRAPVPADPRAVAERWAAPATRSAAGVGSDPPARGSAPSGRHGSGIPEALPALDDRPLAGIRVLDLTHVLAGPFATRILADLGADVIRIQTATRAAGGGANERPYNTMWSRSKRSIQLDLKHPGAAGVMAGLVRDADVVVDNFSAGVMAKLGLGPERLAGWNQRIISMSMTGCGQDGPWQSYVTYAPTIHALSGMTALTGPPGETDCGPGMAFNDHASGLAGALVVLAALEARDRTGRGQHIDLSQLELGTYLVGPALVDHLATGRAARSAGNTDPFADHPVNDVFRCADGQWVAVTAAGPGDVDRIRDATPAGGREPGAAPDDDPVARVANLAGALPAAEAEARLQAAGVAAGVVQTAAHLAVDPQLVHRGWTVTVDSDLHGTQTTERHPARWFDGEGEIELIYRASPYLGQHDFEIYGDLLGWDPGRVAQAMGDGLVS
jgi:crotonobetainyl-CoA:carnitine CoA-transferase CaiB-like acyl-CoA transferase